MGGIGLQLLFIVVFTVMAFKARQKMIAENTPSDKSKALLLLKVLLIVLILIVVSYFLPAFLTCSMS